jgi:hypothetical protein
MLRKKITAIWRRCCFWEVVSFERGVLYRCSRPGWSLSRRPPELWRWRKSSTQSLAIFLLLIGCSARFSSRASAIAVNVFVT